MNRFWRGVVVGVTFGLVGRKPRPRPEPVFDHVSYTGIMDGVANRMEQKMGGLYGSSYTTQVWITGEQDKERYANIQKVKDLKAALAATKDELRVTLHNFDKCVAERDRKRSECSQLWSNLRSRNQDATDFEKLRKRQEAEIADLKAAVDQLNKRIQSDAQWISDAKAFLAKAEAGAEKLVEENQRVRKNSELVRADNERLEKEVERLRNLAWAERARNYVVDHQTERVRVIQDANDELARRNGELARTIEQHAKTIQDQHSALLEANDKLCQIDGVLNK